MAGVMSHAALVLVHPNMPVYTRDQGLTLVHFRAQLEDLRKHIAQVRAQLEHIIRDAPTG
jgi:hypothetical protein